MMSKRNLFQLISVVCIVVMISAAFSTIAVKSIKLNSTKITLKVGQTYNLKATFTPKNTTQKKLTYITGNKKIATINTAGKITGVSKGTTTITVYTFNKKIFAKCNVTISQLEEPVVMSAMVPVWGEPLANDNLVELAMEKICNAKFDIIWVPNAAYNDKLNVSIASQQLPNAVIVVDTKSTSYVNAVRGGMFWEIGAKLDKYENLKEYGRTVLQNSSIDGRNYGLPRERPLARRGLAVRKDWLDKLGLKMPGTLDELYEAAKALVSSDPDGNGKKDTIGLASGMNPGMNNGINIIQGFEDVVVACGGMNFWGEKDGKIVPAFMDDGAFVNALKYYKKLYDEKLINQDFAVVKNVTDLIEQERSGMWLGWGPLAASSAIVQAKNAQGIKREALFEYGFLKTQDGKTRLPAETAFNGVIAFPKTSVKTEAELERMLRVFDKIDSKEVQMIMSYGLEGVHHIVNNGIVEVKDAAKIAGEASFYLQLALSASGSRSKVLPGTDVLDNKVKKVQRENAGNVVVDPTVPFISDTYNTTRTQLDKIIGDAMIKFIMGAIDENGWKNAIEEWKSTGGNKVIEEYSELYAKSKK